MKAHLRTWKEPRELTATFRGRTFIRRTHIPYQWVVVSFRPGEPLSARAVYWARSPYWARKEAERLQSLPVVWPSLGEVRFSFIPTSLVGEGLTAPQPAVNILQGNEPTT